MNVQAVFLSCEIRKSRKGIKFSTPCEYSSSTHSHNVLLYTFFYYARDISIEQNYEMLLASKREYNT